MSRHNPTKKNVQTDINVKQMIERNNVYGKKTIKENEILANFQRFDKKDPQQRNGVIDYSISNVQGLSNSLKYHPRCGRCGSAKSSNSIEHLSLQVY